MNKKHYEAPQVELIEIQMEMSVLTISGNQAKSALGNSSVDDMSDYGDGSSISW